MVYQVGKPAMFEGNRFLPLTGMPILKIARMRVLLAVWLPDPLTVAATIAKSLTIDGRSRDSISDGFTCGSITLMFPDSTNTKMQRINRINRGYRRPAVN